MKITDKIIIELTLIDEAEFDDVEGIKRLDERCHDIGQMLCDEGTQCGTTVIYNILFGERKVDNFTI